MSVGWGFSVGDIVLAIKLAASIFALAFQDTPGTLSREETGLELEWARLIDELGPSRFTEKMADSRRTFEEECEEFQRTLKEAKRSLKKAERDLGKYSRHGMTEYNGDYTRVEVLLLSWEENTSKETEVDALRTLFSSTIRTDYSLSPKDRWQTALRKRIADFVYEYNSPDCLTIVYYGGHGIVGEETQSEATSSAGHTMNVYMVWDEGFDIDFITLEIITRLLDAAGWGYDAYYNSLRYSGTDIAPPGRSWEAFPSSVYVANTPDACLTRHSRADRLMNNMTEITCHFCTRNEAFESRCGSKPRKKFHDPTAMVRPWAHYNFDRPLLRSTIRSLVHRIGRTLSDHLSKKLLLLSSLMFAPSVNAFNLDPNVSNDQPTDFHDSALSYDAWVQTLYNCQKELASLWIHRYDNHSRQSNRTPSPPTLIFACFLCTAFVALMTHARRNDRYQSYIVFSCALIATITGATQTANIQDFVFGYLFLGCLVGVGGSLGFHQVKRMTETAEPTAWRPMAADGCYAERPPKKRWIHKEEQDLTCLDPENMQTMDGTNGLSYGLMKTHMVS